MDRTQQRCLAGSTLLHVGILVIILVASGIASRRAFQPEIPFLEIIPTDLLLTMGNQVSVGTANPPPLPSKETPTPANPPAPKVDEPEPVKPAPMPKVEPKASPVDPVKPAQPKKIEVNPAVRETISPRVAQDVDPTRKADKSVPKATPKIQVSNQVRTRSDTDKRAEREARESAAAEAASRERQLASARTLASRITSVAKGVSANVGASTQIDMPGPNGVAYAPYFAWLQTFLYERWRRPTTSSQEQQWVGMEVVIARDGTVLSAKITRPSGVRSLDTSVETIFREHRQLRPLPSDYKEPRLVVPVKFVLEAPGSQ